jgi:hypothetical protein
MKSKFYLKLVILSVLCFEYIASDCDDYCKNSDIHSDFNCMCQDCDLFNDCCKDVTIASHPESGIYKCNIKLAENNKWIYSIEKCAQSWVATYSFGNKLDLKNQCENDMNNQVLTSIPVYSASTNQVYKNVFCAVCNNENLMNEQVKFFEISDQDADIQYENMENSEFKESIVNYLTNKSLVFNLPSQVDPKLFRKCIKSIDTCPLNSSLLDIELCNNHTAYRYSSLRRIYKNKFCAKCNGISDENELFCKPFGFRAKGFYAPSLQVLFDVSNLFGEIQLKMRINVHGNIIFLNDSYNCKQTEGEHSKLDKMLCDINKQNESDNNSSHLGCLINEADKSPVKM